MNYLNNKYNYFYLKVNDDSMNLKFNNGDFALIQQRDTLKNNEIGAIRIDKSNIIIRKFNKMNGLIVLEPMSSNPKHDIQIYNPKEVEIAIIGKIIDCIGEKV